MEAMDKDIFHNDAKEVTYQKTLFFFKINIIPYHNLHNLRIELLDYVNETCLVKF